MACGLGRVFGGAIVGEHPVSLRGGSVEMPRAWDSGLRRPALGHQGFPGVGVDQTIPWGTDPAGRGESPSVADPFACLAFLHRPWPRSGSDPFSVRWRDVGVGLAESVDHLGLEPCVDHHVLQSHEGPVVAGILHRSPFVVQSRQGCVERLGGAFDTGGSDDRAIDVCEGDVVDPGFGPDTVIEDDPGEIGTDAGDAPPERCILDVDPKRDVFDPIGDFASAVGGEDSQAIFVGGQASQAIGRDRGLAWFILIFRVEGVRVVESEIHGVLNRAGFEAVFAVLPADPGSGIHGPAVGSVVFGRLRVFVVSLGDLLRA